MATLCDLMLRAVDGAFAIDSKQRIIYWDPGCEDLFGYTSEWALGRPCCDVMSGTHPVSGEPVCSAGCCVAAMAGGADGPKRYAVCTQDADGNPLRLAVSIMLVPATCSGRWYVTHLLHREGHPDVLASLEYATHQNRRSQGSAAAIPVINDGPRAPHLTAREREVLGLLAEGLPGTAIASRLAISVTTARNHIQHLHAKLGVHSKTEAVAYAYRHNLV